jgi:hypothetical protein
MIKKKQLNNNPKMKTWNSSHAKGTMHSLEKNSWIDIKLRDLNF